LLIAQLPPLLVCEVTDRDLVPDDVALDDVLELVPLVVPAVDAVELSDSPDSRESSDSRDDVRVLVLAAVVPLALVPELAAAVWVVVADCPSCQASAPPSESIAATLSAVTALRVRAARGLRLGRPAPPARGTGVGLESGTGCSSMSVTVRTGGERAARDG
jgi:hypothetical protein